MHVTSSLVFFSGKWFFPTECFMFLGRCMGVCPFRTQRHVMFGAHEKCYLLSLDVKITYNNNIISFYHYFYFKKLWAVASKYNPLDRSSNVSVEPKQASVTNSCILSSCITLVGWVVVGVFLVVSLWESRVGGGVRLMRWKRESVRAKQTK